MGKDVEVADKAAKNAVENNYLTIREQDDYAKEMTECGKDGHKCKNDVRKKYKAIYDKNKQAKIEEINKELDKSNFLRKMSNQEIKSAIDLVNNRPFREEITKRPERQLVNDDYGIDDGTTLLPERYVSRAEQKAVEDLKDVADFGVSTYPPTALPYNAAKFIDGAVKDYGNGNLDNTIDNVVDFSIPLGLRRVDIPEIPSNVVPAGIELMNDLSDE